jgi:hypothetical protein
MDTNSHGWARGDGCWMGRQDEHRCRCAAGGSQVERGSIRHSVKIQRSDGLGRSNVGEKVFVLWARAC